MKRKALLGWLVTIVAVVTVGCSSEVHLGAVISETGATSAYGKSVRNGMDLALDEVNAEGSVGTMFIHYADDSTNPEVGAQVAQQLIDEHKVIGLIGAISSTVTLRVAEVAESNEIVLLSPSASAPEISTAGPHVFRNYPSDILEGTSMAELGRDLGIESVAIFALDSSYGRGLRNVFTEKYESKYRKVVGDFDFPEVDLATDPDRSAHKEFLRELVAKVKELSPKAIYIVGYQDDIVDILKILEEAECKSILMGTSSVTPQVLERAGTSAEKLIFPQPNSWDENSTEPSVAEFVTAYKARFNAAPDIYAAHGYDAVKLMADAIVRGGTPHKKNVYIGIASTKDFHGAAGRTVFDENGDVVRYPRLYIINEGAATPYDKFTEEGGSLFRR